MKILIPISILTMLFMPSITVWGQNSNDKIKDIKQKFITINQDTGYSTTTLDNEDFLEQMTDGGGQLIGYFKGDTIYKIHERIGLSYCVLTRDYYFWDNQLIFVFEKEDDFNYVDSLATLDYTKTTTAFEGRYYFDRKTLILSKAKGQKRISDEIAFDSQNKSGQLLSFGQDRGDLLRKRRK